jgi:hypothetical protein
MAGGATTTNLNDTFYAEEFSAQILEELRPAMTSRSFMRWAPAGNSTAFSFSLQDDPGPSSASFTEGTDYTTVTDLTTSKATATVAEVGLMTTVSDVLIKVSLLDALPHVKSVLNRGTLEKWETDIGALMDDFTNVTAAASTLTVDDLLAATSALEQRDIPGPYVAYLHPKQAGELRRDIASTTAIVTAGESDSVQMTAQKSGDFGNLFGTQIYFTSTVVSTSNLRGGAVFQSGAALGAYELWGPRIEVERRASLRGFYVVSTACYGLIEVSDTRGQTITSAA